VRFTMAPYAVQMLDGLGAEVPTSAVPAIDSTSVVHSPLESSWTSGGRRSPTSVLTSPGKQQVDAKDPLRAALSTLKKPGFSACAARLSIIEHQISQSILASKALRENHRPTTAAAVLQRRPFSLRQALSNHLAAPPRSMEDPQTMRIISIKGTPSGPVAPTAASLPNSPLVGRSPRVSSGSNAARRPASAGAILQCNSYRRALSMHLATPPGDKNISSRIPLANSDRSLLRNGALTAWLSAEAKATLGASALRVSALVRRAPPLTKANATPSGSAVRSSGLVHRAPSLAWAKSEE